METLYNNPNRSYHRETPVIEEGVTEIENYQFSNCKDLTSVVVPSGVKRIGDFAFHNCINLTSVTLPQSVEEIGAGAFFGCSKLQSINIPINLREIGMVAFSGCSSLKKIMLEDNVQVGNGAFNLCGNLEVLMRRPEIENKKKSLMISMGSSMMSMQHSQSTPMGKES